MHNFPPRAPQTGEIPATTEPVVEDEQYPYVLSLFLSEILCCREASPKREGFPSPLSQFPWLGPGGRAASSTRLLRSFNLFLRKEILLTSSTSTSLPTLPQSNSNRTLYRNRLEIL
jgi:hypothetical protein